MNKFITAVALLLLSAGFGPGAACLFAQGQYGPYSQPQGAPATPNQPDYDQGPTAAGPTVPAQADDGQADASSQPGVARASFVRGNVSVERGDNSDLVPVTLNSPLQSGDRVSTGNDGRAEFELDYADQLRLSGDSTANIATLTRQNIQIQVGQGLANYAVLPGGQAQVEIDTPNAAVHPTAQGDYRILVNSDAETRVIVRTGSADISTPDGSTHVDAGQMITVAGTDNPQYRIDSAPGRDDWDAWNADRDRHVETAQSFRNTNQYYTGSEDLDGYGEWSEVPDYGQVWFPNYGPNWAPYRDGSWVYQPFYGWTWVSYEPWGWAPYHYGRWFYYSGRWGWWPGVAYGGYYPVWAPAYVSFFGWGSSGWGVGVGFGFGAGWGHVGWLPIGPGDWYHPWYGRFGGRYTQVNINNYNNIHEGFGPLHGTRGVQFSNIHDAQFNEHVRSGISSMGGGDFGRGRVPLQQERITDAAFRGATASSGRVPMSPTRESYSPTGHFANAANFREVPSNNQRFFSTNRGNQASLQTARAGNNGFNGERSGGTAGDRGNSGRPGAQGLSQQSQQPQSTRPGWRTFTPPSGANRGAEQQGSGANRNAAGPGNDGRFESRGGPANSSNGAASNGSWRAFAPPSRTNNPAQDSTGAWRQDTNRSYQAPQMSRGTQGQASRPQLNMRQPVVTPRGGSQPYGNQQRGEGNFSEPRGGYNGGYSAPQAQPRGGYAPQPQMQPRGGFSGGGYAPQQAPRGGGGTYSAPRGGGYSPGASRSSGGGGGSRSSGGGGGGGGHHR